MTNLLAETSPSTRGRILAALYLVVIVGGIAGQLFIADSLVVPNDAATTAANIVANKSLYRLAFTIFMLEMAAQVAVSVLFYDLLKPVNRSVARLAAIFGLTAGGIKTVARVFFYAPLIVLSGAPYLSVMQPAQLETLAFLFLRINSQAAAIALIFFGFETLLRGWLVFQSGFLPRFLGVISMIGGLGWLTYLWPPLGSQLFMGIALFAIVGVFATAGWLFIRGVDDAKWRERAALAATSIWR
jgi:Domain of unknown function (DUF4386)